jgi:hypothetical protein
MRGRPSNSSTEGSARSAAATASELDLAAESYEGAIIQLLKHSANEIGNRLEPALSVISLCDIAKFARVDLCAAPIYADLRRSRPSKGR